MATLIGLCVGIEFDGSLPRRAHSRPLAPRAPLALQVRVKLQNSLPARFKIDVLLTPGSHSTEEAVNKQLNDKERVAAALENAGLCNMIKKCLNGT